MKTLFIDGLQPPTKVKARIKAILSFVKSLLLIIKEETNNVITQCCGSVTLAGSGSAMTLKVGGGSAIINKSKIRAATRKIR